MTVAAFVLGIIGTVLAAASLTWQIVAFLLQGARPKLTPVVGVLSAGGLVSGPAARDVTDSLRRAIAQFPSGPLVIGVKVVNAGRAPFHVAGWAVRSEPSTISFVPGPDDQVGTAEKPPCDIAPGAEATFVTELIRACALATGAAAADLKPQQIVLTVSSGGRTFKSEPVAPANLAFERS